MTSGRGRRGDLAGGVGDDRRRPRRACSSATSGSPRSSPRTRSSRPWSSGRPPGSRDNPAAWLTTVARRRAVDHLRRRVATTAGYAELAHRPSRRPPEAEPGIADAGQDDVLRLMLAHLPPRARPRGARRDDPAPRRRPRTDEIARAFLVTSRRRWRSGSPARSGRWPRAGCRSRRRRGRSAPRGSPRCSDVVYLVFNEGYTATGGDDWLVPALCEEAIRLGRMLATLAPDEPEAHGLVALMELQASRRRARTAPDGTPCRSTSRTALGGTASRSATVFAALLRARELGGPPARTCCRPRSPPATPGRRGRGHRLGADRHALRLLVAVTPLARRRAEPGRRRRAGRRARGRARGGRRSCSRRGHCATTTCCPAVRGDLLARLGRDVGRAGGVAPRGRPWPATRRNGRCSCAGPTPSRPTGGGHRSDPRPPRCAFLARDDLAAASRRSYAQTLHRLSPCPGGPCARWRRSTPAAVARDRDLDVGRRRRRRRGTGTGPPSARSPRGSAGPLDAGPAGERSAHRAAPSAVGWSPTAVARAGPVDAPRRVGRDGRRRARPRRARPRAAAAARRRPRNC